MLFRNSERVGWYDDQVNSLSYRDEPFITWSIQVQRDVFPAPAGTDRTIKFITWLYAGTIGDCATTHSLDRLSHSCYPIHIKARVAPLSTKTKKEPPSHFEGYPFVANSTPNSSPREWPKETNEWINSSSNRLSPTRCSRRTPHAGRCSGRFCLRSGPSSLSSWRSSGFCPDSDQPTRNNVHSPLAWASP